MSDLSESCAIFNWVLCKKCGCTFCHVNKFSARVSNYFTLRFIVFYVLKNDFNECKKKVDSWISYNFVLQDLRTTPTEAGQISSLVNKTIEDWMATTKPTWKTQFQLESFPVFHRRTWVEVFLKYNTGIPSSAAIERVFVGSAVVKPKRATLSSENFERLVFIRENENCVLTLK